MSSSLWEVDPETRSKVCGLFCLSDDILIFLLTIVSLVSYSLSRERMGMIDAAIVMLRRRNG